MDKAFALKYETLYNQHWWWRAREIIIDNEIKLLSLPKTSNILDVGCGNGLFFPILKKYGTVKGIEIDANLLTSDCPYKNQISTLPLADGFYPNNYFNLITSLDTIEHVENDRLFVKQMVDLLIPGGFLVLTVPAFSILWRLHDKTNQHFRRYRIIDIIKLLNYRVRLVKLRYVFPSLFFIILISKILSSLKIHNFDNIKVPNEKMNTLITRFLCFEDKIQAILKFPIGSSALAIIEKH